MNDLMRVDYALYGAAQIYGMGFWNFTPTIVSEAMFLKLAVDLSDALKVLKGAGHPVEFTDADMLPGENVHDTVRNMRDAACHTDSGKRGIGQRGGKVFYSLAIGQCRPGGMSGDQACVFNHHADDVAIWYGQRRLLMKRHVERAMIEALGKLELMHLEEGLCYSPHFAQSARAELAKAQLPPYR